MSFEKKVRKISIYDTKDMIKGGGYIQKITTDKITIAYQALHLKPLSVVPAIR